MPASTYLANKLLDHQLGKAAFTMPQVFVGFSSTAPTAAGTNITEPSTGGYTRQATTAATWTAASGGATSNAQAINWPSATADWLAGNNLGYVALFDAATGGNFLGWGALATPKNIVQGDSASIAVGDLDVTLS